MRNLAAVAISIPLITGAFIAGCAKTGETVAGDKGVTAPAQAPSPSPTPVIEVSASSNRRFEPADIQIKVGDTVGWRNNATFVHTVTMDPALAHNPADVLLPPGALPFDSGDIPPGEVFTMTFTVPGQYKYFCKPHEDFGMVGTITVAPAASPTPADQFTPYGP